MPSIFFYAKEYTKEEVTLALESGVSGIIARQENIDAISSMARCEIIEAKQIKTIELKGKDDEEKALSFLQNGQFVLLKKPWGIIPVENLLAAMQKISLSNETRLSTKKPKNLLALEVESIEDAELATKILEQGVDSLVIFPKNLKNRDKI